MKFLIYVHGYPPTHNAGAERYLHNLARSLILRGHQIGVITRPGMLGSFNGNFEGVEINTNPSFEVEQQACAWCDVMITHLDRTRAAIDLAKRHDKPLINVVHNPWSLDAFKVKPEEVQLTVFNSEWLSKATTWSGPRIVCPPILRLIDFEDVQRPGIGSGAVTLSNLNVNKGGAFFWLLARALPNVQFLGVKGYGKQELAAKPEPNVKVIENQRDVRAVLEETRVLLMPSTFESWGMMGLEAAACGIPTVACRTAGIEESLGESALFLRRDRGQAWAVEIQRLLHDDAWYRTRASMARERAAYIGACSADWVETFEAAAERIVHQRQEIQKSFSAWEDLQIDEAAPPPKYSLVTFFSRPWMIAKWFKRLEELELDRLQTEFLCVVDTRDSSFLAQMRFRLEGLRGFGRVQVLATGNRPLPDDREVHDRRARIVALWDSVIPELAADTVICIEDDTLPIGSGAIKALLKTKRRHGANFVQGTEVGRWSYPAIPHYTIRKKDGEIVSIASGEPPPPGGDMAVPIAGCGWYCFVADRELFEIPMRISRHIPLGPDVLWGFDLTDAGYKLMGDWAVSCEHWTPSRCISPLQAGLQHVTWNSRAGGKWTVINRPMKMKLKPDAKLGAIYEQKLPERPSAQNGIFVRALRTWMGEEGHVFRGQELWVSQPRHTFLSQRGWVETLEVPDLPKREAPIEKDVREEEIELPEFLRQDEEDAADPKPPAPPPDVEAEADLAGAPMVQKATTVDRSRPVPSGSSGAAHLCKKCSRSFPDKAALRNHMRDDHKGGK